MPCTLSNKCAKNLSKRTVLLQLIIKNVVTCFFGTQCRLYDLNHSENTGNFMSLFVFSAFPTLEKAGGFELLVTKSGSRRLLVSVAIGAVPVVRLKHVTTGRIYIRPLQEDINTEQQEGQSATSHCSIHVTMS